MVKLEITTVIGCANMCDFCPQQKIISAYKSPIKIMSLDTFKKCIDKVPINIPIIFAGMAEPFQNKECIEMIKYANEKGFLIKIFTTGVGMTKKDILILEKMPIRTFEIHLPSNLGNTKIKVDKNYLELIEAIKNSKIKNIQYLLYGEMHPKIEKMLGFKVEDLSRLIQNRASNVDYMPPLKKLKGSIMCNSSGRSLNDNVLLPNGDVVLCCQDYGLEYKLGNLLNSSYESLFNSDFFNQMQKALDSEEEGEILCRYCSSARKSNSKTFFLKRNLEKAGILKKIYLLTEIPLVKKAYVFLMNFKNRNNLKH